MSRREHLTNLYERYLKKRPRQSRSRTVVEAILRGALDRLARGGDTTGLKVEDVAERAGVGIGSVYDYFADRDRLLAGALAKATEENLVRFEEALVRVRTMSLRDAVGTIFDVAVEAYLDNSDLTRAYVRLANSNDLFPVLVRSQDAVAQQIAADFARREDVVMKDHEVAAWMLTQALMGVTQAMVWDDEPRFDRARVREAFVGMAHAFLTNP
jgi:AcrR family transcriptional regulator